ncbi:hypothetical protein B0H19DRAFT_1377849 [Mycena capillaripes]|nr:hypothetical protein B0H19DRAFT_1377849 [Mycena capillaripes]
MRSSALVYLPESGRRNPHPLGAGSLLFLAAAPLLPTTSAARYSDAQHRRRSKAAHPHPSLGLSPYDTTSARALLLPHKLRAQCSLRCWPTLTPSSVAARSPSPGTPAWRGSDSTRRRARGGYCGDPRAGTVGCRQ